MVTRRRKLNNRELSWLEFNQRVLDEAKDASVPLLERVNFLAISARNLDEFFMVRVGGLELLLSERITRPDASGLTAEEQLGAIEARVRRMVAEQYACYHAQLTPACEDIGVRRVMETSVSEKQRAVLEQMFEDRIFPVITPMAILSPDAFPAIPSLGLHVCVRLKPEAGAEEKNRFALIPVGARTPRFMPVPSESGYSYVLVEDVIRMFVDRFFPGQVVKEAVAIRIARNADLSVREDFSAAFIDLMSEVLERRRDSDCVRLEIDSSVSRVCLSFLRRALKVKPRQVFEVAGPLALGDLSDVVPRDSFAHQRYEPWQPQPSADIDPAKSMFDELATKDILLYHPYDSYQPVIRLLQEAAASPDVLAIKQTLYRTSNDSPVIAALCEAARRGKYVTALVELKARFDEARNIEWARRLEHAGVQVIYGVKGFKTHAKVCIIVRREPQGVVRYLHFGTGNYNEKTACIYSDVSYMTRNPVLGVDASAFFNAISGSSEPGGMRELIVAPLGLRERLLELIGAETERRRQGQAGLIIAKMNSLVDPALIDALYDASKAGVEVRLNVRGVCCLRPGVPGMSETISVVSIVDRFLEHSRVFYFLAGGDHEVYISSADWMPRNLDGRIELMVPVPDPTARKRMLAILETHLADNVKARRILADGGYEPVGRAARARRVRSQQVLYRQSCDRLVAARGLERTIFTPYHAPDDAVTGRG